MGGGAGGRRGVAAALLAGAVLLAGAGCVHEVVEPVRETVYVATRSGDDLTLTWVAKRGMYYNVFYSDRRGADARWTLHPRGTNLRASEDGEQMELTDRVPNGKARFYRLVQDAKPLVPTR